MSTHDIESYFAVAFDYIGDGRYGMAIFETFDYGETEDDPSCGHFELIHKHIFNCYETLNDYGQIVANDFFREYRAENYMTDKNVGVAFMCPPAFEALALTVLERQFRCCLPPIDKKVDEMMAANDRRLARELSAVVWE